MLALGQLAHVELDLKVGCTRVLHCTWPCKVPLLALHLIEVYDGHLRKVVDAAFPGVCPCCISILVAHSVEHPLCIIFTLLQSIVLFIQISLALLTD